MARIRRGRGRSGRRARPARRGGAPVRQRLLSRTCGRSRREGAGVGRAGAAGLKRSAGSRERGLSVEDDLSYLREFEHITLARLLLAQHTTERAEGSLDEATRLLERLLRAAEDGRQDGSVIEILVLQALAHQARGDIPAALASLRTRADAGRAGGLRPGLRRRGPADGGPAGGGRETAESPRATSVGSWPPSARPRTAPPANQGLIEPLSERELDVLRLLGTDLDGPDIARELVVSLNTVRTHTKNIYAKLGVNNRRAAVRRAEELDLLSRTASADRADGAGATITTSITTCGDARSPHLLLPFDQRTSERRRPMSDDIDRQPRRGRAVRDPPQGAPRRPLGRLVRRAEPHPRERRHHRHPWPGRRPGRAARPAPEGARPRPAAGLGHPGRTRPARRTHHRPSIAASRSTKGEPT